jgi:hypothetical protein
MYKTTFALAVVAIISGASVALADDSGHTSIDSLKSQMRHQIRHMHRYSDALTPRYATSLSNQTGCPTNFSAYDCSYWAQ